MFKKILTTIIGISAILLALFYVIAMLLNHREFFGPAITYLLVACIAVLMVFFISLMVSNIVDLLRKRNQDEDSLEEKHIEKIFTGASAVKQHKATSSKRDANGKKGEENLEEEFKSIRKQAEYEAKKAAEAAAEKKRQEKMASLQKADLAARKERIAKAEDEARQRAEESPDEDDRRLAAAEVEALHRAAIEAQEDLEREEQAQKRSKAEQDKREREAAEAMALRKTQAIESVRRQAEAAAAARRRAAATTATQAFSTIGSNSGVMPAPDVTTAFPAAPSPVGAAPPPPVPDDGMNLWERMAAPQAAPAFGVSSPTLVQVPLPGNTGQWVHPGSVSHAEPVRGNAPTPSVLSHSQQFGAPSGSASAISSLAQKTAAQRAMGSTQVIPVANPAVAPVLAAQPRAEAMPVTQPRAEAVPAAPIRPEAMPVAPQQKTVAVPAAKINGPPGPPPNYAQQAAKPSPVPASAAGPAPVERPSYTSQMPPVQQAQGNAPVQHTTARESAPSAAKSNVAGSAQPELPRRRGRPPKPRTEEELNQPKRPRGRPPKPRTEEQLNQPKRPRGRPPKPKTEEELNKPKRPRGRPPKNPEAAAAKQEQEVAKQVKADKNGQSKEDGQRLPQKPDASGKATGKAKPVVEDAKSGVEDTNKNRVNPAEFPRGIVHQTQIEELVKSH